MDKEKEYKKYRKYNKIKGEYEEAYKNFKSAISEELKGYPDLLEKLIKITDSTMSKL